MLTGVLEDATDIAAALELYARQRLRRVRRVQRAARFNGLVYHAGPLVALARDRIIGRLGAAGMTDRYAWLYGYRPSLAPARGSR